MIVFSRGRWFNGAGVGSMDANAQKLRRHIGGNLLVIQIGQYRTREPCDLRRIGNPVEDGLSNWVLHDYYSVRGSVFDRTLQTSPAKAAAGDALHHRGRERARAFHFLTEAYPALAK